MTTQTLVIVGASLAGAKAAEAARNVLRAVVASSERVDAGRLADPDVALGRLLTGP